MSRFFTPPATGYTPAEMQARAIALEEADPWYAQIGNAFKMDVLSEAANTTWAGNAIGRWFSRTGYTPDPNWSVDDATYTRLTDGIDPVYHNWFLDADSEDEAQAIRGQAAELTRSRQKLAEAGLGGSVATIATSMLSPENVAIMIGTAGIGGAVGVGAGVSRSTLAQAARLGFINAATTAPFEAIVAAENPDVTARDAIAATAGAFGFGAMQELSQLTKVGRGKRFIYGGAGMSVPSSLVQFGNEDQGASEWAFQASLGFVMGGAFNLPSRQTLDTKFDTTTPGGRARGGFAAFSPLDKNMSDAAERAAAAAASEVASKAGAPMTDAGAAAAERAAQSHADAVGGVIDGAIERPVEVRSSATEVPPGDKPRVAMGAAGKDDPFVASGSIPFNENLVAGDFSVAGYGDPRQHDFGTSTFGLPVDPKKLQFFMGETAAASPSDKIAWVAGATGTQSLDPSVLSASAWAHGKFEGYVAKRVLTFDPIYREHVEAAKAKNVKPLDEDTFWTKAYNMRERLDDPAYQMDPVLRKAAEASAAVDKPIYEMMKRHGVGGSDDFTHSKSVTRHVANREALETLMADRQVGEARMVDFIAGGIRKKLERPADDATLFPELAAQETDDELDRLAKLMAKAWVKNAGTHNEDMALAEGRLFGLDQRETLAREAKALGINERLVDSLIFALGAPEPKDGATPFKQRIPMDLNHSQVFRVTNDDGSVTERLISVRDLMDRNAVRVHDRLARAAVGQSALAEVLRGYNHLFGKEKQAETYGQLMADLSNEAGVFTLTPNAKRVQTDVHRVDVIMRGVIGMPINTPTTPWGRAFVAAIDAITRLVNAAAMATPRAAVQNLTELSRPLWTASMELNEKFFAPELSEIVKSIHKGGSVDNALLALAMEDGFGTGMANRPIPNVHDAEIGEVPGKFQHFSQKAARAMYVGTGQTHTSALAEKLAYLGVVNKLYDSVKSSKQWGTKVARYLSDLGLSEQEATKIRAAMEAHSTKYTGDPNFNVMTIAAVKSWDDQEAASIAHRALVRAARREAMKIDPSQNTVWGRTAWGKILLSLRRFGMVAWGERFLWSGARIKDVHGFRPEVAFQMAFDSFWSTLVYATGVGVASIGRSDRKEYLAERLSRDQIIKATFGKATWASLLPMGIDTTLGLFGSSPQFAGLRANQSTRSDKGPLGILTGVPLGAYAVEFTGRGGRPATPLIPIRAMIDNNYQFSQQDMRQILNGAFFPNIAYAKDGVNYLSKKYLREKSEPSMSGGYTP